MATRGVGGAGIEFAWRVSPRYIVARRLRDLVAAKQLLIEAYLKSITPVIQQWMYDNAPWQDRSWIERQLDTRIDPNMPNARESLVAEVVVHRGRYTLSLHYMPHVYYATYLEYAMQGRFEILVPAYDHWYPIVKAGITAIVSATGGTASLDTDFG